MQVTLEFIHSINQVPSNQWQALSNIDTPFQSYAFLQALEQNGCVGENTGWLPQHLLVKDQQHQLVAAVPMYQKNHSYGEYVFDFAWAEAYQRHQLDYFPKLIAAIPFTPVTGSRLLLKDINSEAELLPDICHFLHQHVQGSELSSLHWLFPPQQQVAQMEEQQQLTRSSIQFQWFNRGYSNFDDFLQTFTSRKRKNVNKERGKIQQQGITVKRLYGEQLTEQAMLFFSLCYQQTYLKRSGHAGYLHQEFFKQLLETMGDNILLVQAEHQQQPIASALYFYNEKGLFGRYWGALEEFDALHFECCYYQGIEFCIENKLDYFNPGTQGEHKLLRGFEPISCYSSHWLKEPMFQDAVARFVKQEHGHTLAYKQNCQQVLPFKQN